MNKLDKQYQDLLQSILDYGVEKKDRTGTGTKSIFGYTIRHNMQDGFPVLTTKKMAWKTMVTELLWFLRGDTNIKFLVENGCHIWDGDAYKNYEKWYDNMSKTTPFTVPKKFTQEELVESIKLDDKHAEMFGDLGPIYGKQWRSWEKWYVDENQRYLTFTKKIDQIQNLINDLKTNPDSRRLMVSAWNVGELDQMVLPPCHYGFQVYTRELSQDERYDLLTQQMTKLRAIRDEDYINYNISTRAISLMWNQRSVDTFLGLPFNIASYGLLLTILAKKVNMVPDQLIGNLGDTHLYLKHIEQAKEQIGRDLTDKERYDKWFNNNYETGMEKFFDPNNLPDFDNKWFEPTPKRTREPFELPQLEHMKTDEFYKSLCEDLNLITHLDPTDFTLKNYQSHPSIKAPLSN